MVRLTAKERILLHLLESPADPTALETKSEGTQDGIAAAAGFPRRHFTTYMRPLIGDGLVVERLAHVKDFRQRRKVYSLTGTGAIQAKRLRDAVGAAVVRVRHAGGLREMRISDVLAEARGKPSVLRAARYLMERGYIDLEELGRTPHPHLVERVTGMPRLDTFVGRARELEALTDEERGPRVFFVRGIAGIGKTALAAKACGLLHGKKNLLWHRTQPWDTAQSLLAVLGDFLTALGRPTLRRVLATEGLGPAPEILQRDLPGTDSFLVFDDAHKADASALSFFAALKGAVANAPDVRVCVLSRHALRFFDRRDVVLTRTVGEIELSGLQSEEVAALAGGDPDAADFMDAARQVGGHPLFLELISAARREGHNPGMFHDVDRFIDEEIYSRLDDQERSVLKLASLYQVPVPAPSLLPERVSSEVLRALLGQSLIRSVGEDAFEVHDTIRGFFDAALTGFSREQFQRFAIQELRRLSSQAIEKGARQTGIAALSNALALQPSPDQRTELLEAMGDTHSLIGDWNAAVSTYRELVRSGTDGEFRARMHRKAATALDRLATYVDASQEAFAGLRAIGDVPSPERGWLEVLLCHLAIHRGDFDAAQRHGESALDLFRAVDVASGQLRAVVELGQLALLQAAMTGSDVSAAIHYFEDAVARLDEFSASELRDGRFLTWVFTGLAATGRVRQAVEALVSLLASAKAAHDPNVRLALLEARVHVATEFLADLDGADEDLAAIRQMPIAASSPEIMAWTEAFGAYLAFQRGDLEEARAGSDVAMAAMLRVGRVGDAMSPMWLTALCSLLCGDVEGFRRVARQLEELMGGRTDPEMAPPGWYLRGVAHLLEGDRDGCRADFETAIDIHTLVRLWLVSSHFYYGVVLRAVGDRVEGEREIERAADMARRLGAEMMRSMMTRLEEPLVRFLSQARESRG